LAAKWNMTFKNDVVIDLICYRRHGHNEQDQPTYTHPIMYHAVYSKQNIMELYAKQLIEEKVIDQKYKDEIVTKYNTLFDQEYQKSKSYKYRIEDWFAKKSSWRDFKHDDDINHITPTGVSMETLKFVGKIISGGNIPKHFVVHKNLQKILDTRRKMIEEGKGIDWATAESLAIGSLLIEGTHVRFSGQDVQRGTFSQRHAVIHDQKTNEQFTPLAALSKNQAVFQICNSSLSEYGILGYEYGYSIANPYSLVIWEAQFGDFANGAQVIIDQFISSGETKWLRQSGLVMLLPHGYEGNGPEHSSGRIERFLQLSDDDPDVFPENFNPKKQIQEQNWQICNITTPANFFHVLRRQIHRFFRKPLIVFTPKFLLRYKYATSELSEMGPNTIFQRVYGETNSNMVPDDQVKRVIFCTGKVYYTLWVNREEMANKKDMKLHDIAIIRLEQLFPFPFDKVHEYCMKYKNADIVWVQEEPKNMGAWTFVYFRILTALRGPKSNPTNDPRIPSFVGRPPSASPATGYPEIHAEEEKAIIQSALAHYYS
jgi:2-oxoglutarate dehydrogenase E1 component